MGHNIYNNFQTLIKAKQVKQLLKMKTRSVASKVPAIRADLITSEVLSCLMLVYKTLSTLSLVINAGLENTFMGFQRRMSYIQLIYTSCVRNKVYE
jgi:hypothetical protein